MLCYSVGPVTGDKRVGGLVGSSDGGSTYLCYWDVQTGGLGSSKGGRGKSTDQMKSIHTFRGWGYQAQWATDEGNDYPRLAWEGLSGVFIFEAPCEYGGGTGSPSDPYRIRTAGQFLAIGYGWPDFDKHFVLMQDIDLNDIDPNLTVPVGTPGIPFSGSYDGNGHTMSGFKCSSTGENHIGTFGHVGPQGIIRNAVISNADVSGSQDVGALAGSSEGSILNCSVSGCVSGWRFVGGLAGSIKPDATVSSCSSTVDVAGGITVGGLVGYNLVAISPAYSINYMGDISDSYSSASVDGNTPVAGLVAANGGIISRCHSSGQVAGIKETGGLVGGLYTWLADYLGSTDNCYWDMDASGQETSAGGEGKTTAQMKQRATFVDWDFGNVWDIAENQTYPFLRRHPVADLNYDARVDLLDLAILAEHWLEGLE